VTGQRQYKHNQDRLISLISAKPLQPSSTEQQATRQSAPFTPLAAPELDLSLRTRAAMAMKKAMSASAMHFKGFLIAMSARVLAIGYLVFLFSWYLSWVQEA
jgi:hypothetical protein